jgi:hypothetical protein
MICLFFSGARRPAINTVENWYTPTCAQECTRKNKKCNKVLQLGCEPVHTE